MFSRDYFGKKITKDIVELSSCDKDIENGDVITLYKNGGKYTLSNCIKKHADYKLFSLDTDRVCKIFDPKHRNKYLEDKLKLLCKTTFKNKYIVPVLDLVYYEGKFVGFVTRRVIGSSLTRTIGDSYSKENQLSIILKLIKLVDEIHANNIILGAIDDNSFLVDDQMNVYYVSVDEAQIEDYPIRYKMDYDYEYYSHPTILKGVKNILNKEGNVFNFYDLLESYYKMFYYDEKFDNYAIAIIIFKIIFRFYPYIQKLEKNIEYYNLVIDNKFPYKLTKEETMANLSTDMQKYEIIWAHLPLFVKKMFVKCFTSPEAIKLQYLKKNINEYYNLVSSKKLAEVDNEYNAINQFNDIAFEKLAIEINEITESSFTIKGAVKSIIQSFDIDAKDENVDEISSKLENNRVVETEKFIYEIVSRNGLSISIKGTKK